MYTVRETKYSKAILQHINEYKHASNADLLTVLEKRFPAISATTIHRASSRLYKQGRLALAPSDYHGAMRYDSNLSSHDHFLCDRCDGICDIDIADIVLPALNEALVGCKITGRLVIHGTCESCLTKDGSK